MSLADGQTTDLHAPTGAGPAPEGEGDGAAAKVQETAAQAQEKAQQTAAQAQQVADERPETLVGAAFAGGFLAALILKRLGN